MKGFDSIYGHPSYAYRSEVKYLVVNRLLCFGICYKDSNLAQEKHFIYSTFLYTIPRFIHLYKIVITIIVRKNILI